MIKKIKYFLILLIFLIVPYKVSALVIEMNYEVTSVNVSGDNLVIKGWALIDKTNNINPVITLSFVDNATKRVIATYSEVPNARDISALSTHQTSPYQYVYEMTPYLFSAVRAEDCFKSTKYSNGINNSAEWSNYVCTTLYSSALQAKRAQDDGDTEYTNLWIYANNDFTFYVNYKDLRKKIDELKIDELSMSLSVSLAQQTYKVYGVEGLKQNYDDYKSNWRYDGGSYSNPLVRTVQGIAILDKAIANGVNDTIRNYLVIVGQSGALEIVVTDGRVRSTFAGGYARCPGGQAYYGTGQVYDYYSENLPMKGTSNDPIRWGTTTNNLPSTHYIVKYKCTGTAHQSGGGIVGELVEPCTGSSCSLGYLFGVWVRPPASAKTIIKRESCPPEKPKGIYPVCCPPTQEYDPVGNRCVNACGSVPIIELGNNGIKCPSTFRDAAGNCPDPKLEVGYCDRNTEVIDCMNNCCSPSDIDKNTQLCKYTTTPDKGNLNNPPNGSSSLSCKAASNAEITYYEPKKVVYENDLCRVRCSEYTAATFQPCPTVKAGSYFSYPVDLSSRRLCKVDYTAVTSGNIALVTNYALKKSACDNWERNNGYLTTTTLNSSFPNTDPSGKYLDSSNVLKKTVTNSASTNTTNASGAIIKRVFNNRIDETYEFADEAHLNIYDGSIYTSADPSGLTKSFGRVIFTKLYLKAGSSYPFPVNLLTLGSHIGVGNESKWKTNFTGRYTVTTNDYICPDDDCPELKGIKFMFRPISLEDPFPEREARKNWQGFENLIDPSVYDRAPIYEINLNKEMISRIRSYNKTKRGYTDQSLDADFKSNFIKQFETDFITVSDVESTNNCE